MPKSKDLLPPLLISGKLIMCPKDEKRFWNLVNKTEGCWLWKGSPNSFGYGRFWLGDASYLTHRLSYLMHIGPVEDGLFVLHRCDVPACVNPKHLWKGTKDNNSKDMVKKKRHKFGDKQPMSKVTETKVKKIRKLYAEGFRPQWLLGEKFGICQQNISDIVRRKLWRHLP